MTKLDRSDGIQETLAFYSELLDATNRETERQRAAEKNVTPNDAAEVKRLRAIWGGQFSAETIEKRRRALGWRNIGC